MNLRMTQVAGRRGRARAWSGVVLGGRVRGELVASTAERAQQSGGEERAQQSEHSRASTAERERGGAPAAPHAPPLPAAHWYDEAHGQRDAAPGRGLGGERIRDAGVGIGGSGRRVEGERERGGTGRGGRVPRAEERAAAPCARRAERGEARKDE
eukprot:3831440-Rhodomonas_salina.2